MNDGGEARIAVSKQLRVEEEEEDPVMKTESCKYARRQAGRQARHVCRAISRRASVV